VGKLAFLSIFTSTVLGKGAAQFGLVAAGVDLGGRGGGGAGGGGGGGTHNPCSNTATGGSGVGGKAGTCGQKAKGQDGTHCRGGGGGGGSTDSGGGGGGGDGGHGIAIISFDATL